jgi:hypothetical protein
LNVAALHSTRNSKRQQQEGTSMSTNTDTIYIGGDLPVSNTRMSYVKETL